jgi:uncharacterized protein (TIGR00255 family)
LFAIKTPEFYIRALLFWDKRNLKPGGEIMGALYSMTGFATEKKQFDKSEITCEIRALNSRYLEIYAKVPTAFKELEDRVKEIIRSKIGRAKITCSITFTSQEPILQYLKINPGTVGMYKHLIDQVRGAAGIKAAVQVSDILQFKDIFVAEEESGAEEELIEAICEVLTKTVDQLNNTRGREGENLKKDLVNRLSAIESLSQEIEVLEKGNARREFEKQYQRLLSLIDENKIDRNRLEMELAIISDRVDISEEVVRMKSHLELFRKNLEEGSPIGKKLNFILQEMHREANTMSTKNTLVEVSHKIVTIKEEIERMREQVQNIE